MELILEGKSCGFSWSAAHLLPGHYKCSRMHGHNYVLDLHLKSMILEHGMIVDFVEVKKDIREFIEKYDHKLFLPSNATNLELIEKDEYIEINYKLTNEELDQKTAIKKINNQYINKSYLIPKMDISILPITYTTVEKIGEYFKREIINYFISKWKFLGTINIILYEDDGQGVRI